MAETSDWMNESSIRIFGHFYVSDVQETPSFIRSLFVGNAAEISNCVNVSSNRNFAHSYNISDVQETPSFNRSFCLQEMQQKCQIV